MLTRSTRRVFTRSVIAAALAATVTSVPMAREALAQDKYPSRPVRIVLPFGAGGVADITTRLLAQKLEAKFGQRFIVDNQPGAGGITAARAVLSSKPDGYTLGLVTNGTAISVAIFKSLPFDPLKEFELISTIGNFDQVFGVSAKSPFKSLGEFIKAAKDQPGKLNLGTIVVGSTQHLGAELFKSTAGIDVQLVTFRRTPEVIVGLERNDIQMMIDFYAPMRGALDAKKVRAVAVSGSERIEAIPDVPTAEQAGVKNYVVTSWNGLFAPAGTPKPIVDALNAALVEILALPDVKKRYAELGITARASTPAVLRDRLVGDIQKWGAVIEKAKIPKR